LSDFVTKIVLIELLPRRLEDTNDFLDNRFPSCLGGFVAINMVFLPQRLEGTNKNFLIIVFLRVLVTSWQSMALRKIFMKFREYKRCRCHIRGVRSFERRENHRTKGVGGYHRSIILPLYSGVIEAI